MKPWPRVPQKPSEARAQSSRRRTGASDDRDDNRRRFLAAQGLPRAQQPAAIPGPPWSDARLAGADEDATQPRVAARSGTSADRVRGDVRVSVRRRGLRWLAELFAF